IRDVLLPEAIARHVDDRSLLFWSVGCSTGEEAYSLAAVARELIPAAAEWQIRILGTDVNPAVVERAQEGLYGPWSVRGLAPADVGRVVEPRGTGFVIRADLRPLVAFRVHNVLEDPLPSEVAERRADLILWRNVAIYLTQPAIDRAVRRLAEALADEAVLIVA